MLTETQKQQLRLMISYNPNPEYMAIIRNLTDNEVIAEIEKFKTSQLVILQEDKKCAEDQLIYCQNILSLIEDKINLLNK